MDDRSLTALTFSCWIHALLLAGLAWLPSWQIETAKELPVEILLPPMNIAPPRSTASVEPPTAGLLDTFEDTEAFEPPARELQPLRKTFGKSRIKTKARRTPPSKKRTPRERKTSNRRKTPNSLETSDDAVSAIEIPIAALIEPRTPTSIRRKKGRRPPAIAYKNLNELPGNRRPNYPVRARILGLEGRVRLGFVVTANGKTRNLRILRSSGHSELDSAAQKALARYRFENLPRAYKTYRDFTFSLTR